ELYPGNHKMAKQMKYANGKNIPFVAMVGSREMETGVITVKNMESGEQHEVDRSELIEFLS
ncbi:MAG: His/Gly/Thr/Pro-type tRNA ligase C-terminal domain-containing protein, partial [Flavobacteriales bacterium]